MIIVDKVHSYNLVKVVYKLHNGCKVGHEASVSLEILAFLGVLFPKRGCQMVKLHPTSKSYLLIRLLIQLLQGCMHYANNTLCAPCKG